VLVAVLDSTGCSSAALLVPTPDAGDDSGGSSTSSSGGGGDSGNPSCVAGAICKDGNPMRVCTAFGPGGACASITYTVGVATFTCAGCTDCTTAQSQASVACGSSGSGSGSGGGSGSSSGSGDTCGGAAATVVDNFYTCDTSICDVGGRSGTWYSFASANVHQTFAVSVPPSGWVDQSCAAWSTGGPGSGTASSTFAGIGATLNNGAAINLAQYSGVTVRVETGQEFTFVVKDSAGGYFGQTVTGGGIGSITYPFAFASLTPLANSATSQLDLSAVTAFEFDAVTPLDYGFAVHSLTLY
jgi:hypothetical protein